VYNSTTVGMGLGELPSKLLAWGLGSWAEVEIEIVVPPPVIVPRAGGGGGGARTYYFPDATITIRTSLDGKLLSEQKFEVDQREIPNVVAKIIKLEPKILKINIIRQQVDKVEVSDIKVTKQKQKVEVVGYERNPKV